MQESDHVISEPKIETSREAWPASSIDSYTHIDSGDWGYLVFYSDGSSEFLNIKPSNEEIYERWGYTLHK